MKPLLTSRQEKLLRYIETTLYEQGHVPTLYEMADALGGITVKAVKDHLSALEKKGILRRIPGKRRAMDLSGNRFSSIPILGRVVAGSPVMAIENLEGNIPVDPRFFGREGHFALKVKGDSMTGAGIHEGDYVIVRQQDSARSGDIVVALIGDEATVKVLRYRGKKIFLEAVNPAYQPILLEGDDRQPRILGRVVGLVRKIP